MRSQRSKPGDHDAEVLLRRVEELEDELEDLRVSAEDAQQQAENFAGQLGVSDEVGRDLRSRLRSLETTCSSLQERNRELSKEVEAGREALKVSNEELHTHAEELEVANEELQASAAELEVANEQLHASNKELDERVRRRTAELAEANESLRKQIGRRETAEAELRQLNDELEQRIAARTEELRESQARALRSERLAVLGELAATVSHELRNPLGVVANSLVMVDAKTRGHDLGLERFIDRMKRNIDRCDRIISEMLDYARQRKLIAVSTDVDAWVTELLGDFEQPDGVELRYEPGCGNAVAEIDQGLIRSAIINLVANAGDALLEQQQDRIERAHGEIVVSTHCADGILSVTVSDNGPGMPEEVQATAFEPLFSTKSFGVGLGLAIVRKAVTEHGGSVELDTRPGDGTRITLKIPVEQAGAGYG